MRGSSAVRRRARVTAGLLVLVALTASCAARAVPAPIVAGETTVAYHGPLWVEPNPAVELSEDPGAAGRAVECHFEPSGRTNPAPYDTGEVGDTPDQALRIAWKERQFDGLYDELGLAAEAPDRRLYVVQRDGRNYQALIFRHGPATKGTGVGSSGVAWWLESQARCDIAEFPDHIAEDRGWQIWTDDRGRRQPITVINSAEGTDCVAGTRILEVGNGHYRDRGPIQYVANGNGFPDFFDEPYRAHLRLPADAVGSPYRHGAELLWFSPDRERAYVGAAPSDVALWPRTTQLLGCA